MRAEREAYWRRVALSEENSEYDAAFELLAEIDRLRALVAAQPEREKAYNIVETEARALTDYVQGPYATWKARMLVDAVLTLRELKKAGG